MRVLILYPYLPSPEIAHGSARLMSGLLPALKRAEPALHLSLLCAYRPSERDEIPAVESLCDRVVAIERRFATDMGRARRTTEATRTGFGLLQTGWPVPVVKLRRSGFSRALDVLLSEERIDLVHVELATMAQYVQEFQGRPSVLVDHEAGASSHADDPRWPRYVNDVYPAFDRLMCLSEEDAAVIAGEVPGKKPLVRPPAIRPLPDFVRRPDPNRVFFFGSLDHEPNRDAFDWIVQEIMPRIRAQNPAATCRAAGFRGLDEAQGERARRAGVECLGFVEDLGAEFARAACVLAPLRRGHGVRIKNLEAMAAGVPLVTTPLGLRGLPKFALTGETAEDLAERVLAHLRDPADGEGLASRARVHLLQSHTPEREAELTLGVWRELIALARS